MAAAVEEGVVGVAAVASSVSARRVALVGPRWPHALTAAARTNRSPHAVTSVTNTHSLAHDAHTTTFSDRNQLRSHRIRQHTNYALTNTRKLRSNASGACPTLHTAVAPLHGGKASYKSVEI